MTVTTFLIADDSPHKMAMLKHFLHAAKWEGEVLTAATTEEAMHLIDAHDIGFAFVDYYMPSRNGPAVIAYLKKKNPAARIALVSSADSRDNCAEAKAAGAEVCLCTSQQSDAVERDVMNVLNQWLH